MYVPYKGREPPTARILRKSARWYSIPRKMEMERFFCAHGSLATNYNGCGQNTAKQLVINRILKLMTSECTSLVS